MKEKACNKIGFDFKLFEPEERVNIKEERLLEKVKEMNKDPNIDGLIVQLPLPSHINSFVAIDQIDPLKDVDGLTKTNAGKLALGEPSIIPCTPLAILTLLEEAKIDTKRKHATIVGRSNIVGKPLFNLLIQKRLNLQISVSMVHSETRDISELTRLADILIVAAGSPALITPSHVKEGAVLIDVGINSVEDKSKKSGRRVVGDISRDCYEKCGAYTPVPGGVGVLTVATLMHNTLLAANLRLEYKK